MTGITTHVEIDVFFRSSDHDIDAGGALPALEIRRYNTNEAHRSGVSKTRVSPVKPAGEFRLGQFSDPMCTLDFLPLHFFCRDSTSRCPPLQKEGWEYADRKGGHPVVL